MSDSTHKEKPEAPPSEDMGTALRRRVLPQDGRYAPDAYFFLYEALAYTQKLYDRHPDSDNEAERHVTGRELVEGIRLFAREQFGRLAPMVFRGWGIGATEDFGRMVFNLVEADMMSKTDTDTIQDFINVFDIGTAFDMPVELQ